ncbi:MAG: amidohydrolase family protein [Thermoprotei archaeon]
MGKERLYLKLGGAFLGRELRYEEDVLIEVEEGKISSIGKGTEGIDLRGYVAFPPLVNAHAHTLDYSFKEFGVDRTIRELVADPNSLKYEMFKRSPSRGTKEFVGHSRSYGVGAVLDFVEEGVQGVRRAKSEAEGLRYYALGRLDSFSDEELKTLAEEADGFGLPSSSSYSPSQLEVIYGAFKHKVRAAHVSETVRQYLRKDWEVVLNHFKPSLLVHATHFTRKDFEEVLDLPVVFCPRSNMWHGVGIPRIAEAIEAGVKVMFGTDNGAWNSPNLWEDLRLSLLITRLQRPGSDFSREILKGATTNAYDFLGLRLSIEEGNEADFYLYPKELLEGAFNPYVAIIKRAERPVHVSEVVGGLREFSRLP